MLVDFRHLDGGKDGVAIIDLDPESEQFGQIIQQRSIGEGVLPHHLYFNRDQTKLYTTALGGSNLYEITLKKDAHEIPHLGSIKPIDTHGNIVGEDIYFTQDGSRFYMTFLGGQGDEKGGSIGVFEAQTNELVETILAPVPEDPSSEQPFIMHPHGISANEELGLLMVTSTVHPDLENEVGNTVSLIDMKTNQVLKTYLVADSPDDLSQPIEVLLLRDNLPPYALVTTAIGGDIWVASYNSQTGLFNEFEKKVEGEAHGLGVPLEFYIHQNKRDEKELYVSFGVPGVVNVYGLDQLPELPLKRTLPAGAGAHHMVFFETKSGREALVVQNNLLNLDGLNAGSLTVVDIHTGELLRTLDLPTQYGLMPEAIESAFGHGHDYHH
jgi:DNA-binding beta-propeller fold protein YncE